jgi:broad specificity phosphatase PhoE
MSATTLFLIRHAEVEAKYHKVFGGQIDMELSPLGHTQAQTLANYLRRKRIEAIYASPMKRVQLTLAPYLTNGAPQPVVMPGLREVDFGDWTGHNYEGVREKFGAHAFDWLQHLEQGTIPNAEPLEVYRARVEPCLREILDRHPSQSVAVFCHGGVIRMLLAIMLELPLSKMSAFEIDYASVSEIELQPGRMEIQLLNFAPWRELDQ